MATLSQKMKLLKGLLAGERACTGPLYVTVDLTRRCNLHCLGCRYHSPYVNNAPSENQTIVDISPHLIRNLCEELMSMNTYGLVLEGAGEPLLHPDILELVATIKTAGFFTTLLTNGTLLKTDLIQTLINLKFDMVKVSLWAASPEQYQQNYPGTHPDNFQKVKEGMKLMAELKAKHKSKVPSVILHFPINRNNYQGIDALADLALAIGCNGLSFAPMYTVGGTLASFALSPAEEKSTKQSLSRLRKRLNSLSLSHNIDEALLRYELGEAVWQKMPCYTPWFHARIRVDGTVLPCTRCDISLGNLNDHSFRDIWNGSAVRAFRLQAIRGNKLPLLREHCDCNFCCFIGDNARVHRFFKWFSPFLHYSNKGLECPVEKTVGGRPDDIQHL